MDLPEFVKQVQGFKAFQLSEKVLVIGYWFHEHQKQEWFKSAQVNAGFDKLHEHRPANAASLMKGMSEGSSKRLIRSESKGFKLNSDTRERIEALIPAGAPRQGLVDLKKLEAQIGDPAQRTFLGEAIVCFEHHAYRAAIVMAWNLAYHHACAYIVAAHLGAFNMQLAKAFPKKKPISKHTDFEDLQESEVIEVAKGAQIFSKTTAATLKAKLDIRNMAAHPSSVVVLPIKAEEVISDLVQNVILRPVL
jgi:hypothetical protein